MAGNRTTPAGNMAMGGIFAALAVVLMALGTWIPVATYTCPVLCMLLLQGVYRRCGSRIAWAWYGAVALLSCLLAPDKEAAAVFVFLGYYPVVKPRLDKLPLPWLWKGLLFNGSMVLLYALVLRQLGIAVDEPLGLGMAAVLLALGNLTFYLTDRLLSGKLRGFGPRRK